MGLFRFFLALGIFFGHANNGGYFTNDIFSYVRASGYQGAAKIHCFFLISGFFSEMLINTKLKNAPHYIMGFYTSRLIRLLPCYYFMLLATYWFVILAPQIGFLPISPKTLIGVDFFYRKFDESGWWYILCNLIPLVPETIRIYNFDHSNGVLYLLVNQAWSLSIEYVCLIIAPFIFRSQKLYFSAFITFAVIALLLAKQGIYRNYALTTVIFFLLGSLAYRFYMLRLLNVEPKRGAKIMIMSMLTGLILYVCVFGWIEQLIGSRYAYIIFMTLSFASLPFLFMGSTTFLKDKWIGDLAYPIYLNHTLVLWVLWGYTGDQGVINWLAPILSVGIAGVMVKYIDFPLQRWRANHYYQTKI